MEQQNFPQWLQAELDKRGWTQAKLARRSGLTSAYVSLLLSGQREIGLEGCKAIAQALNMPDKVILQAAGRLQQEPEQNASADELEHLYRQMDEQGQEFMVEMAKFILKQRGQEPPNALKVTISGEMR